MTAYQLLKRLMVMVESTDFNRCSAARGFKGQYDVFVRNNTDDLMFLEHEEDKRRMEAAEAVPVTATELLRDGDLLIPLEQFMDEATHHQPDA